MRSVILLLLQIDAPWREFIAFGPGFVALIMILIFLIRMAPTWKEVKLRELDLRGEEVKMRGEEGKALGALANVLDSIAVRQTEATENVQMLQRVNVDSNQKLNMNLLSLNDRLDRLDRDGSSNLRSLIERVESLEHNVNPQTTAAPR
jgi:hypothetical protein